MSAESTAKKVLLTGASGYVGGRLLPLLEARGIPVRCLTRRLASVPPTNGTTTEIVVGDVLDEASLDAALSGIETAYYLIHSMGDNRDFEQTDRRAATNFANACSRQGVQRIVYLGGLGNPDHRLSKHLRSRQEIGEILRTSTANVIEFRASIIIGSGSLSFEMIRALVERLPIMICPKWVRVMAQPIAIDDVLAYLIEVLQRPLSETMVFEIGGPDQISYGEIMRLYAEHRGLKRWMIPVPLLTPYLSSLWLGLVTPLYSRVGRKLVESLRNPTLMSSKVVDRYFTVRPRTARQAIARALSNEDREFAATRWSDAFSAGGEQRSWGGIRFGSRLIDSRTREVLAAASEAFQPIRRIGGNTGWYYGNGLWKIRGFLDLLVGGVGVRRGRRDPDQLRVGDAVDFWRVEQFEPNKLLRLAAEMKVPGRAWLEFEVSEENGVSTIRQTAMFDPMGLFGIAYWYALFPLHQFVFNGMLRNICRAVETSSAPQVAETVNQDHNAPAYDSNLMMVGVVEIQKLSNNDPRDRSQESLAQPIGLATRFNRLLFVGLGMACLVCAAAGAILPLIPCTPFVLLAAYCFARSSPRLHHWLRQSRLFGPFIRDWQSRRAIHIQTKRFALAVVALSLVGTLYFLQPNLILASVIIGVISIGIVVILRLPTYS